jgi:PAS domain S-box-containing protein
VSRPLQVLIVEDSENDAALLEIELKRAGYAPTCERVETPEAMRGALDRQRWDLVIADYRMPRFGGLEALGLVKERGLDLPFIIVSGHITEDAAVAAMKAGAHDYVMKDKLARLGPAVERELRDAGVRHERRRSQEQLEAEQTFRAAIEQAVPAGIAAVDLEGRQTYVNPAFCAMVGWSAAELVEAKPPFVYWPPEEVKRLTDTLGNVVLGKAAAEGIEVRFKRRDEERFDALVHVTALRDASNRVTGWVGSALDITERKRAEARLAAEHAVTRILANASSFDEAAPAVLEALLESLEVDAVQFWLLETKRRVLVPLTAKARRPSPLTRAFLKASAPLPSPDDPSLPGRVWRERRAAWITDLSQDAGCARRDLALKAGLRGAAAFPIQNADAFVGVLELFAARRMTPEPTLANMLNAISSEIGQFVRRWRAEEDLRHAHGQLETRVQQRTADLKTTNAKLQTAIIQRKRLEYELLEITERERRRIGLDLHDDLGQKLAGLALMTKGLERKLARRRAAEAADATKVHDLVREAMSHARDLAHDLATVNLKESNLPTALEGLAKHAAELFKITCRFKAEGTFPHLEPNVVSQLCRIAQEAVTNAIKHAKAKRVAISLANGSDRLVLVVQNNGLSFPDLKGHATGMGLRIMNYRASLIGASLEIESSGPHGTRLTCSVPIGEKR